MQENKGDFYYFYVIIFALGENMKKKWILINKKADFDTVSKRYNVDPVIAKIVTNRGVLSETDLEEYFSDSINPPEMKGDMKDLDRGVSLVADQIKNGSKLLVIGDYDADGVCSTAILVKVLKKLGADVNFRIPHRIEDGYGMNAKMVEEAFLEGISCIVTCDNGISCFEAVEKAKELGIKMVITDHHNIPYDETDSGRIEKVPSADAVINPHQKECPYPFEDICGAMVALRFAEALLRKFGINPSDMDEIYDFAAIATMTDIMPLNGENRQLVKRGLNKIPFSKNAGLKALCELKVPGKSKLSGRDIGHLIGPCINATGRISTADKAVELLLTADEDKAAEIARRMQELNVERISMTQNGTDEGIKIADTMSEDKVLVIYMPNLHESIAGLVAGRVREHTGKPTIVITDAAEGAKGSGRSVDDYCMIDELVKCKELLTKYGGHPMAAGISLAAENIETLRNRLNENCMLSLEDLVPKIRIDAAMPLGYVTEKLITDLEVLEPTGRGNEPPVFAQKDLEIVSANYMGNEKQHLKMTGKEAGRNYSLVLFGGANEFVEYIEKQFGSEAVDAMFSGRTNNIRLCISYRPQINEYNGRRMIQFVINHYQ